MAVFAELHDGRRLEFPDGTKPEVVQATVQRVLGKSPEPPKPMNLDPTEGMSWFDKAAAGVGKSVADTWLGLRQMTGNATQEEVDERRRIDAPLMNTTAGVVGNVAGQVAQLAVPGSALTKAGLALRMPVGAVPFVTAGTQSAAFGAAQPTAAGESRLENAALSGALGVAGQGVANLASTGARLVARSKVSDDVRSLYDKARAAGIPVNMAQLGDSKFVKTLQSTLERTPFTGGQAARDRQQEAFNRAVSRTFGEDAPRVTRDVYAAAKARIGGEFERLSSGNTLPMSQGLTAKLADISEEAKRFGTDDSARAVANAIDEIFGKLDDAGNLPGRAYQSLDSKFGKLMKAGGEKSVFLGELREAMRSAMDESISAADKLAWNQARGQYKNLKTVRDLVAKEGADGNINPALLMGRMNATQAGKEANAMGRGGELLDLARVGRQFVRDPIPDSGTASRLGIYGLLGLGSGADYGPNGLTFDPTAALLAAGGAATLGRVANTAINSRVGNQYLLNGGAAGLLGGAGQLAPTVLPAVGLLSR